MSMRVPFGTGCAHTCGLVAQALGRLVKLFNQFKRIMRKGHCLTATRVHKRTSGTSPSTSSWYDNWPQVPDWLATGADLKTLTRAT